MAQEALSHLQGLLAEAGRIDLVNVRRDKFGGRVVVEVRLDGRDLASSMIHALVARPCDGGARRGWCD